MKHILFLLFVCIAFGSKAQSDSLKQLRDSSDENTRAWLVVEEMPLYPGGDEGLMKYIQENLRYSEKTMEVKGIVYAHFVVTKTGAVKNIKIIRGLTPECDAEALRVLQGMQAWRPGKQNGIPVNVEMNIPIRINLKR